MNKNALLWRAVDLLLAPAVFLAATVSWLARRAGIERLPLARAVFRRVGVFPVRRHYYEPMFEFSGLRQPLAAERPLPGIDLRIEEQLRLVAGFGYADELSGFPDRGSAEGRGFYFDNGWYGAGDAEFLYSLVRQVKPRRIVEVGSGHSSLIAAAALARNAQDGATPCRHVCIEPYERPWLEENGIEVIRRPVERVDRNLFADLGDGDILFIDSSHIIRPQGDVLTEILEILPGLKPGVYVHFHDIFSPRDYPSRWLADQVLFWNEQYLLEAFLSCNDRFQVVASLNHLTHHHFPAMAARFPALAKRGPAAEPAAFWIRSR